MRKLIEFMMKGIRYDVEGEFHVSTGMDGYGEPYEYPEFENLALTMDHNGCRFVDGEFYGDYQFNGKEIVYEALSAYMRSYLQYKSETFEADPGARNTMDRLEAEEDEIMLFWIDEELEELISEFRSDVAFNIQKDKVVMVLRAHARRVLYGSSFDVYSMVYATNQYTFYRHEPHTPVLMCDTVGGGVLSCNAGEALEASVHNVEEGTEELLYKM